MSQNDAEVLNFRSEASQLLDIVIHSLYSNKEIFLRELISNSSDALDKRRFEALTRKELAPDGDYEIRLEVDPEKRTLSVWDNGIGMTRDEAVENLGTIARSGTKEFAEALGNVKAEAEAAEGGRETASADAAMEELIGRFGVGFYSSFMVANEVEVVTRKAGEEGATRWESTGDGTFKVSPGLRAEVGTTVTLHLAATDVDKGLDDFSQEHVVRRVVKRYSDFVTYPIKLKTWKKKDDAGDEEAVDESQESGILGPDGTPQASKKEELVDSEGRILVWETLNTRKAIWTRPEADVSQEEYQEFYRHISHDWGDYLHKVAFKAEGTFEYSALVFLPKNPPFNLHNYSEPYGLQLYVNRVLVKSQTEELLPRYLRFIKGVVDSPDLSLNVSREMLQDDGRVRMIRKRLVRKVLDELAEMKKEDRDKFLEFWAAFGSTLKEGVAEDVVHRDRIKKILLFPSSAHEQKLTGLDEYVERMKEGQEHIYYITGESRKKLDRSPQLEIFKEKEIEVLYLTDPIDDLIVGSLGEFEGKSLKSAAEGGLDLSQLDKKEEKGDGEGEGEETDGEAAQKDSGAGASDAKSEPEKEAFEPLMEKVRGVLQDGVKEVRVSHRLTTSPACLVGGEGDLSPRLVKLLERSGQSVPTPKRVLELNLSHPLVRQLKKIHDRDPDASLLEDHARLLYGQSLLAEGGAPEDPAEFSRLVVDLMVQGLGEEGESGDTDGGEGTGS